MTLPHRAFATALLAWYRMSHRPLPWRDIDDPYRIWLSEIMLQQTQVVTVLPYYRRFIASYPDIGSLAAADTDEVMRAWEGLGYYARCRNMLRAARRIVEHHRGVFPDDFNDILALPGVGRSTAGAIASFAFGQRWPICDGNVRRVLSRVLAIKEEITRAAAQRRLWTVVQSLVEAAPCSAEHNQAIMELGAQVCLLKAPKCDVCPVAEHCLGRTQGHPAQFPVRRKRKKVPHYHWVAGVIRRPGDQVLLVKRPQNALLGGLWEFPGSRVEASHSGDLGSALQLVLRQMLGVGATPTTWLTPVRHAFSHFKMTLHCCECELEPNFLRPLGNREYRWVSWSELDNFGFPRAHRKVIDALNTERPAQRHLGLS